jgi:DnaJ-class molecular chaperone
MPRRKLFLWFWTRPKRAPRCSACKGTGVQPRSKPPSVCRSCLGWGY